MFQRFFLLILCLLPAFLSAQSTYFLHQDWEFRQKGGKKWYPAKAPGNVYLDLMENRLIPDPFWGMNERELQWVEKKSWEYRLAFDLPEEARGEAPVLVFEGLDTYAEVRLNGALILETDNMFREWRIPDRKGLKPKGNLLEITFLTPLQVNKKRRKGLPYHLTAGNDASEKKVAVYTRKAQFQFGWDWAPRLLGCGIWKPVFLEWDTEERIRDAWCRTTTIDSGKIAELELEAELNISPGSYRLVFQDKDGAQFRTEKKLKAGEELVKMKFTVSNPELWWPHNMGEPYLYRGILQLWEEDEKVDEKEVTFGIRMVELVEEEDTSSIVLGPDFRKMTRPGKSFYFKINNTAVFLKGANWVPPDPLLPREGGANTGFLLKKAKEAGLNTLRVWGGGVYGSDQLYQLCDSLGIMVWQDFMFACGMYPGDEEFLATVREEAVQQLKRLRKHPSLVLWCGNNEVAVGWKNWGWQNSLDIHGKDSVTMAQAYELIFKDLLPNTVKRYDPERAYTHTSPLSNWRPMEEFFSSSMHYWGVWHGPDSFPDYHRYVGRLVSEYGFQSFPMLTSVKQFSDSSQWTLESPLMQERQKSYVGNGKILEFTEYYYGQPYSFEDFLYKSQLTQLEACKQAIYAHRKNKGHCMGSLFWQWNDAWPGPSWSAIDYYGREKALYFHLSELYHNLLIVPSLYPEALYLSLVSDEREDKQLKLVMEVLALDGEKVFQKDSLLTLPANEVIHSGGFPWKDWLDGYSPGEVYFRFSLLNGHDELAKTVFLPLPPKQMKLKDPGLSGLELNHDPEKKEITIRSSTFVKGVYLEAEGVRFSNNFLDLEPGIVYKVPYQGNIASSDLISLDYVW